MNDKSSIVKFICINIISKYMKRIEKKKIKKKNMLKDKLLLII